MSSPTRVLSFNCLIPLFLSELRHFINWIGRISFSSSFCLSEHFELYPLLYTGTLLCNDGFLKFWLMRQLSFVASSILRRIWVFLDFPLEVIYVSKNLRLFTFQVTVPSLPSWMFATGSDHVFTFIGNNQSVEGGRKQQNILSWGGNHEVNWLSKLTMFEISNSLEILL